MPKAFDLSESGDGTPAHDTNVGEPAATRNPKAASKASTYPRKDDTNDHDYYPTRIESLFGYVARHVGKSPYYELYAAVIGEFLSTFFQWFPILMVIGFVRTDSSVVAMYHELTPVFLTVLASTAGAHYVFRRLSTDANPSISFFRAFLPDTTRYPAKYSGVKQDAAEYPWLISATVITLAKLTSQFVAALVVVIAATFLEPKGNLGFPGVSGDYDGAGFPYMMPDASGDYIRAGSLLFIAAFMDGLVRLSMSLEFVKIRGSVLESLYIGFGATVAFLMSYYATSSPLNFFMPMTKMIIHQKWSDQPRTAIFVPPILGYGLAFVIWFFIARVTSQSGKKTSKEKA